MTISYWLQPAISTFTNSLLKQWEEHSPTTNKVKTYALNLFLKMPALVMVTIVDLLIWIASTILVFPIIKTGFKHHLINFVALLTFPFFAMRFAFVGKIPAASERPGYISSNYQLHIAMVSNHQTALKEIIIELFKLNTLVEFKCLIENAFYTAVKREWNASEILLGVITQLRYKPSRNLLMDAAIADNYRIAQQIIYHKSPILLFTREEMCNVVFALSRKFIYNGNDWRFGGLTQAEQKILELVLRADNTICNIRDTLGNTPMTYAIIFGNIAAAKILNKMGADFDESQLSTLRQFSEKAIEIRSLDVTKLDFKQEDFDENRYLKKDFNDNTYLSTILNSKIIRNLYWLDFPDLESLERQTCYAFELKMRSILNLISKKNEIINARHEVIQSRSEELEELFLANRVQMPGVLSYLMVDYSYSAPRS